MGLEVLNEIASAFINVFAGLTPASRVLAWIGIGILLAIAGGYLVIGLMRAFKMLAYMKVKQFIAMMAIVGVVFIMCGFSVIC